MAGEWIKMRKSLLADGRVIKMSSALKADRLRTVGGLFAAWCLFDEQTENGTLAGYTPEVLDELIHFKGMARAMESVGWLEIGENYLKVLGFEQHNGQSAKRRAQDSVRKASARKADKKRSREEKRREEYYSLTQAQGFEEHWKKWCDYIFEKDGIRINEIEAETTVFKLCQVGADKAKKDIDFSILKRAKSILDSNNDFSKSRNSKKTSKESVESWAKERFGNS